MTDPSLSSHSTGGGDVLALREHDEVNPPVEFVVRVAPGQIWIDPDGTSWYVTSIGPDSVHLERTVTETRKLRDLVLGSRQPNETHPLHGGHDA